MKVNVFNGKPGSKDVIVKRKKVWENVINVEYSLISTLIWTEPLCINKYNEIQQFIIILSHFKNNYG